MGKNIAIICNGEFPKKEKTLSVIKNADYIVCCDGALKTFLRKSKTIFGVVKYPDVTIGDLDSLSEKFIFSYKGEIIHIEEQKYNDMTKAFAFVMKNLSDISHISFIGATGKREDHTIGNISLLMEYGRMFDLSNLKLNMLSDYTTIIPIFDSTRLKVGAGRQISILTPDNSLNIKSKGLHWKTDDVVFDNWWKATLNRADEDFISLTFNHPSFAVLIILE